MFKKITFTSMIVSSLLLADSGVGININEQDLELEGILDSRNLAALQTSSTIFQADINFLNNNEETKLFGMGVGATNKLGGVEGVEITLGAKFIWSEVADESFTALPLMLKVRYSMPPLLYNIPPIGFEGKLLYAPKVLSFGESVTYNEYRLSADVEVIENVKVYAGWRNIHARYVGIKPDLFNTSFYGGLKFAY